MTRPRLAINRTVAPGLPLADFLALARNAGAEGVEIRNDVPGREFADGTPASEVRARIAEAGLAVASINALQRFNDWTPAREREAAVLAAYARDLGAPGIVLCPVIDESLGWSPDERLARIAAGLRGLAPILADAGVTGYVEPLGMRGSTMDRQAEAVEAMQAVGAAGVFRLCYDTFQSFRRGDPTLFPEHVGLVHVSGITRTDLAPAELTEPDRGLVGPEDRVENLARLSGLPDYSGFVSLEPFDPSVQRDPDLAGKLAASLARLRGALEAATRVA
ncbi:TIM barrel protein [Amaricoccus solimangrovi]|uniref:TIM barrel protein n=1 Tax=Amaricoccus solimangrovi TaxID=2589815 RepID=A0A501WZW9_9RHOB|nr:TIM barrel protein [Amaricoccus solimangrovi]TPE51746.1 TIM barrel protein [Amaricoccus solimangrovi]